MSRPADAGELLWRTGTSSLGKAGLGCLARAGREAQTPPVASPSLTEHKVIVGGGTHGVKHVGFIWDLELWCTRRNGKKRSASINGVGWACESPTAHATFSTAERLAEAEIPPAEILHVVLL